VAKEHTGKGGKGTGMKGTKEKRMAGYEINF
jgi:hypothetical protein